MGHAPPNARGVKLRRSAVPVAVDQRPRTDGLPHLHQARDVRLHARIGAKLHLYLGHATIHCASRAMRAISSGATQVIEW
jgi:hypothetical protein